MNKTKNIFSTNHSRGAIKVILLGLGCIFLSLPLFFHSYAGSFMRLNGDDFCYGATQAQHGFWGSQGYAYQNIGILYKGNRYSLNLAMDIAGLFPPKAYAFGTLGGILFLLAAILFTLYHINKLLGRRSRIEELMFIGLTLVTFTIYVLPDVTQILYWRSGMSTYLLPVIINIFLLVLILWAAHNSKPVFQLPLIFITSLLAGGFSETTAVMQFTWVSAIILLMVFLPSARKFRAALIPAIVAFIANMISLLLLAFSPAIRIFLSSVTHPSLFRMVYLTLRYTAAFFYHALKGAYIPYALVVCLGFFFFFFRKPAVQTTLKIKQIILIILGIAFGCFIITAASMAPSVYAQNAYPEMRALFPARFVLVVALFMIGFYSGAFVPKSGTIFKINFAFLGTLVGVLFILVLGAYMVRASIKINGYIPKFQKWANYWDARDAVIREDKQNAILDVNVINLDHVIYYLIELTSDPKAGYNRCAATYYGVNSITADLPGWDQ